jgi:hypothetical protein
LRPDLLLDATIAAAAPVAAARVAPISSIFNPNIDESPNEGMRASTIDQYNRITTNKESADAFVETLGRTFRTTGTKTVKGLMTDMRKYLNQKDIDERAQSTYDLATSFYILKRL